MKTSPSCPSSDGRSRSALSAPSSSAAPSTSRMFETTLPASEPRTTPGRSSAMAMIAMMTSGALPKLALSNPPIRGPVCSPACSVASPISHASGTSEMAARANRTTLPGWATRFRSIVAGASASEAQRNRRATAAYPSDKQKTRGLVKSCGGASGA